MSTSKNDRPIAFVLTFNEAAAMLRISRPTLYELVMRGEIHAKKAGNRWRFSQNTIVTWLEQTESRRKERKL